MLPLAGDNLPRSPDQFVASLRAGLERHQVIAKEVRASGGWPALDELSLDLTGAQLSRETRIAKPAAKAEPDLFIRRLALSASPLSFESVPLTINVNAEEVRCGFARDKQQEQLLQILEAKSGTTVVELERSDLEALLERLAGGVLAKHGAEIKSTHLEFTGRNPRTLEFHASVKAKVFVMNAEIRVKGQLSVDDSLNLRAGQLTSEGNGMIATLVTGYLQPRFVELEKRIFPLASFSLGEVHLRDVLLSGGETLRLEAHFGE